MTDKKIVAQSLTSNRVWELDFFRGFAIIMVVFDHAMVAGSFFYNTWAALDVGYLTKFALFAIKYLDSDLRLFWRPVFLFIFFFVSGICTAFSRNNFLRGLKLGGAACFVSWATYLFDMLSGGDYFIFFGVLHCFAAIILIYALVSILVKGLFKLLSLVNKKISQETYTIALAVLCVALSALVCFFNAKYNTSLYDNEFVSSERLLAGMFVYTIEWASADYFPLMPFIGFFFLGAGLSRLLYFKKQSLFPMLDGKWNKPFALAGRVSLFIYVFAQVIVFALLALLTYASTGTFLFG